MSLFAYLDPGSGSLLIQVVIAALVSTGFLFRQYVLGSLKWVLHKIAGRRCQGAESVGCDSASGERRDQSKAA
jgi:hypothetical protein